MAYVKGKGYIKTGYTPNQKTIASWIVSGRRFRNTHIMLRKDAILRGYSINPEAIASSHWYNIVKRGDFSTNVIDLGGGRVEVVGRAGAGGHTKIYRSRFGITIINTHRVGKRKGPRVSRQD